jgi:hypothetical protein
LAEERGVVQLQDQRARQLQGDKVELEGELEAGRKHLEDVVAPLQESNEDFKERVHDLNEQLRFR